MDDAYRRLEPDREERERLIAAVVRRAQAHLEALATAPAVGRVGAEGRRVAESVSREIPEEPLDGGVEAVLDLLDEAVSASLTTPGPGYLAYVPGGGLPATALASFYSDVVNRFTGVAAAAPALARLEADVLAWACSEVGYGPEARGLLTSGGSLATWTAMVTARVRAFGDAGDYRAATAYASSQAHHSVRKCLRLAGLPATGLRVVGVDERYRLRADELARALEADRAAGLRPFLVVASAGTTNTGAIDPLGDVADVASGAGAWLHVDAAYGGAFVLCEEGRRRLSGIERADSITLDPHKGLFLPYGTGCLLVREGRHLLEAHREGAGYLQDFDGFDRDGTSPSDLGPELSRDSRGLRLWLPLMLHGASAFRSALAEKLELAGTLHEGLRGLVASGRPLEIVAEPQLTISAFRLRRHDGEELGAWNRRNARLLDAVNGRRRVYLSSTALPVADGEAFTLRTCLVSFRTHAASVQAFLEDLDAALEDVPGE